VVAAPGDRDRRGPPQFGDAITSDKHPAYEDHDLRLEEY
jgi:hypothetical protein